jgi:hypothetical protein
MIISVHIPKTAGTSFREDLIDVFGARVLADYGDFPEITTPEGRAHDERRRAEMLASVEEYAEKFDAIHGHFTARKYLNVFPDSALVTLVRDPYQHAVSAYAHADRDEVGPHPGHLAFKEQQMTVLDLVEAFPNHQSLYFSGITVDEFAMIGLTERYEQSVALFETIFGIAMPHVSTRRNANPNRQLAEYEISADLRRTVQRHRAEDIELYRRARERFDALCAAYGI